MCTYPARLGILIPGGLRPIHPCPLPLLGQRAVIAIMSSKSQGTDCRSFRFSHAPLLTVCSTSKLLVGCSGGQFARHWSSS